LYRTIQGLFVIALVYSVYKAFRTDDEDVRTESTFRVIHFLADSVVVVVEPMILVPNQFRSACRGMCAVAAVAETTPHKVVDIEGLLAHFNSHADMGIGGLEETLRALGRGMKKSQVDAVCGDDRFRRLLATIGAQILDLDHRSLAAVAAALSAMPTSSTPEIIELCQRITVAAIKRREEFKPTALASLAMGLASRGSKDPSFIEMVKEDTLAQIDTSVSCASRGEIYPTASQEFSPSELCSILEAQRRWGEHDRDLTEVAIERLTDEIDRFTVTDLVRTLEVVASLGLARGMLLRRLSALAHDQIPRFTPPQLVDILKSLCQLRFLSTVQIEGILEGLGDIREALRTPRRASILPWRELGLQIEFVEGLLS
ncbi:hypothetical protein FOZ63_029583, partial [Perkinsus olseni]